MVDGIILILAFLIGFATYQILRRLFRRKEPSRTIPLDVKLKVLSRFNGECALCSEKAILELHHRHPYAKGGEETVSNLIALCPTHHAMVTRWKDQNGK